MNAIVTPQAGSVSAAGGPAQQLQELMTRKEAARWFRRSTSWLRGQRELLRLGRPGDQPVYHVRVCRAYLLGRLCGLSGPELRQVQVDALAAACGLAAKLEPEASGSGGAREGKRA